MKDFANPEFKILESNPENPNFGKYQIGPLESGLGNTIGNSIRRTLLSIIPGSAVYSIRINDGDVRHEFESLDGVKEDVPEIVLNIKKLVLNIDSSEEDVSRIIKIDCVGPKIVKASDIETTGDVEIINKDLVICTLTAEKHLRIDIDVCKGRGFVLADTHKEKYNFAPGIISVDSNFSPIVNATYEVKNTLHNNSKKYENVIFTVETNGAISPREAIALASRILISHLELINDKALKVEEIVSFASAESKSESVNKDNDILIENLNLSQRSYNCLKRNNILTLNQLCEQTENDIINLRNLGSKSFLDIKEKVELHNRKFKDSK